MDIGIATIVDFAIEVYTWLIFARIILSWIRINTYNPVVKFIYETTEPVLGFFRKIIPPVGMIDFSPIAAFFVIKLLGNLIFNLLRTVGL